MSDFKDLPTAVVENANFVPKPALQPLVADPVCLAHPMLQALPSIAIPGFACPRNVVTLAYWLLTGRFYTVPLGHAVPLPALISLFEGSRDLQNFPIGVFVHNPLAPLASVIFQAYGVPRQDGFQIIYIPPFAPGNPPHFAFIQRTELPLVALLHNNYVYFGSIPVQHRGDVYWHADRPSPAYHAARMAGLACLCPNRCHHEPPAFRGATTMAFDPSYNVDYFCQVVDYRAPYSGGPKSSIHYVCTDGSLLVQEKSNSLEYQLVHDVLEQNFSRLRLRMYSTRDFRNNNIVVASSMLCFSSLASLVVSRPRASSVFQPFRWKFFSLKTAGVSCALFGLSLSAYLLWQQWWKVPRLLLPPLPKVRTWLPPTIARMPYANALRNRQAASAGDPSQLRNSLRRLAHEYFNEHLLDPAEVDDWVERVATAPAQTQIPNMSLMKDRCHLCRQKFALRKRLCVKCRRLPIHPEYCYFRTQWVGMLPLYSQHPKIPIGVIFRGDIRASYKGVPLESTDDVIAIYNRNKPHLACYGRLCGPMFLGFVVHCYPRGIETTMMAFAVRLGVPVANIPDQFFWDSMVSLFDVVLGDVHLSALYEVWTEQQVLEHQRDSTKREKLRKCFREMDDGDYPSIRRFRTFGAFPKLEKHTFTSLKDPFDPTSMVSKAKRAPRLINSPHPHVNARMSTKTIPLLKWLKNTFHERHYFYYAGCSTPSELNDWLNDAIEISKCALEDDVSMMDASQNEFSQDFMAHVIRTLLSRPDYADLARLLNLCRDVRISQSGFRARASDVNASGVPLTSFLNSLTTAFVRMHAIVYAYTGYSYNIVLERPQFLHHFHRLKSLFRMAVAGDDGLVFLPTSYAGLSLYHPDWLRRYIEAWTWSGFDVGPSKIKLHPPGNWRLSTFLAMRPVWSGSRYEFGVEIARRFKSMFWMLDKSLHPFAWGRGVATSLMQASRHVPVVRLILEWYLARTKGTITHVSWVEEDYSFTNPDSTMYNYRVVGDLCQRGIDEFLSDYCVTASELDDFSSYLGSLPHVLVNLDHIVLRKILSYE